jgi:hypothetical protein
MALSVAAADSAAFSQAGVAHSQIAFAQNSVAEAAGVYPKQPQFFFVSANFSLNWHAFPLPACCLP